MGFDKLTPEQHLEVSRKGGRNGRGTLRGFAKNPAFASEMGKRGKHKHLTQRRDRGNV